MDRKMTESEKKELRKYMDKQADKSQLKREGINDYLKQDLVVPLCLECENPVKEWEGDIGRDTEKGVVCANCDVRMTRKSFKRTDKEYKKNLSKEAIENIEEEAEEIKFERKEVPVTRKETTVEEVHTKGAMLEKIEGRVKQIDDLDVLKNISKKHGIKIEISALEE